WIGCGACEVCQSGEEQLCRRPRNVGLQAGGGFSDRVVVPHPRYLLPHDGIPVESACTYACSGLTAFGALKKAGTLGDGDPLVIIGAGGVGLAGVRLAQSVTGVAATVVETSPERRSAALEAGADAVLDPADDSAMSDYVKRMRGAAVVIDFVGAGTTVRQGFDMLRKGGKLVVVGLFGGDLSLPAPSFPLRNVTITGSYVGSLQDFRDLLALVSADGIRSPAVGVHRLDEAEELLRALKEGRITGRAVMRP
ncbi:MAG: zinc-binding dehydrogenase, partial [Pseudomonadota bacterium]